MHKLILYLLLVSSYTYSQTIDYEDALDLTITNNKKLKYQKLDIE